MSARPGPCGGRSAMIVPTAISQPMEAAQGAARALESNWRGTLRLATLVGCTGIPVHSALEFNLQVPATAAFFFAFSALTTSLPSTAERSMPGFEFVAQRRFLGISSVPTLRPEPR